MDKKRRRDYAGDRGRQTLADQIRSIIRQSVNNRRNRKIALFLAGIVVFSTTYALILPALTLDQNQLPQMPGMSLGEKAEYAVSWMKR